VPLVAYAALPATAYAVFAALRSRRWVALAVGVLVIPPTVFAGAAVFAYGRGAARLQTVGMPDVTLYNVDRETRYQRSSAGCIVWGNEWVHQAPNNATLRALSWLLGPMPGAYDGPYPTEAEAREALAAGARPSAGDLATGRLTAGGEAVAAPPDLLEIFRSMAGEGADVRITIWQERLALFGVTPPPPERQARIAPGAPPRSVVILVDRTTGRVVAYLGAFTVLTGGLPVPWS